MRHKDSWVKIFPSIHNESCDSNGTKWLRSLTVTKLRNLQTKIMVIFRPETTKDRAEQYIQRFTIAILKFSVKRSIYCKAYFMKMAHTIY
jgi:hypothetical protein